MKRIRAQVLRLASLVVAWVLANPVAAEVAPIPDHCVNPPAPPAVQTFTPSGPWQHRTAIEHHRGLVYRDIEAEGISFLKSFHMAFLELTFDTGREELRRIVRFCSGDDPVMVNHWNPASQVYTFGYLRAFRERDIRGDLYVEYRTKYAGLERPCAGRPDLAGSSAFARLCSRWVPVLSYDWTPARAEGSPRAILVSVRAHYRIDYGRAGIVLISDPDWTLVAGATSTGLHPIQLTETRFTALDKGRAGEYDNIHPVYPETGRRTVVVPGCRSFAYDCTHLHWRWGGQWRPPLDPLVDPFTGRREPGASPGGDYLSPGHTIEVVVAADRGEGDVLRPDALVDGDTLATAEDCSNVLPFITARNAKLRDVVNPVVVWFLVTSDKQSDTFFRYGFFGLERLRHVADNSRLAKLDNIVEFRRQLCDPYLAALLAEFLPGEAP